jgi:hypothetical protein
MLRFWDFCALGVSAVRFCCEVMSGIARAGGLRPIQSRARCPRSRDGRSAAWRRDARAPRHWRDALRAGATLTLPGEQLVRRGRSAACGRDACAPRGAGRCCCGRDACAPRQWRDALRAGATPAHPGSGGMRCMQTRRPRSQGSSSCGAVAALRAGATPAHPGVQGCATRSRAPALPDACSDKPVPHQGGR